jgi:hypothetical protein
MHDYHNNKTLEFPIEVFFDTHSVYFLNNPTLKQTICKAIKENKTVLHSMFQNKTFQKNLDDFNSENKDLETSCIWNVALFYSQMTQRCYRPGSSFLFNFFNDDMSILHKNIDLFLSKFEFQNVKFEIPLNVGTLINDYKQLGKGLHTVSINGRCDMLLEEQGILFEIKASGFDGCSNQWITQALMYSYLSQIHQIKVKKLVIANVLSGQMWSFELPENIGTLEDLIQRRISTHYFWNDVETSALVAHIQRSDKLFSFRKHFKQTKTSDSAS